ncbi:MAG TPA: polysaccharide biosynthesis/export family protein [Pirellulales bacterium]|jgi:polysaccharide export outer membrane protein
MPRFLQNWRSMLVLAAAAGAIIACVLLMMQPSENGRPAPFRSAKTAAVRPPVSTISNVGMRATAAPTPPLQPIVWTNESPDSATDVVSVPESAPAPESPIEARQETGAIGIVKTPEAAPESQSTISMPPTGEPVPVPQPLGPLPEDDDLKVLTGGPYAYDAAAGQYGAGAAPVAAWPGENDCPPVPNFRCGVKCQPGGSCYELNWKAMRPIPWQIFAQGEYIGPHRLRHVPEYRMRVDDQILLIFRLTTVPSVEPYVLAVGDELDVESLTNADVDHHVIVQPDGRITLRMLGQVRVAGRTVASVRQDLEKQYEKFIREPTITVTPTKLNSKVLELRATIDARQGFGGQQREVRVTPEGTIQLPGLGSVPAQGLTLSELKREIDVRYKLLVHGFEVTPILTNRAPRYIYVVGEVTQPGRYELLAPTTAMQSIALAGGWKVGGNLAHVVVFRRDDCWQLMATVLEIHLPLFGKSACPADEIWLRDSDIIVVPKRPIKVVDDAIELVFTRGLYGVIPFQFAMYHGLSGVGGTTGN